MSPIRFTLIAVVSVCGLFAVTPPAVFAADGRVTGLIKLGAVAVAAGKITFYRDNGQFFGSKLKDGKFTIDRAPEGRLKVTIEGKGIPTKYASEDQSGLTVEIEPGENQFDFELEG